jgi:hypothetical protein
MIKFFKKKKKKPENLKEVLTYIRNIEKRINDISEKLDFTRKMAGISLQKVGVVRFNPFKDMGGDQSFSIALLDFQNNGLVISSIYSREGNRVYTKPIKNGESEYQLSDEEKEAISRAMGSGNPKPEARNPK